MRRIARPLRMEFTGAVYQMISRGDRRESIYVNDKDRRTMFAIVEQAIARFDAQVAYCLMGNRRRLCDEGVPGLVYEAPQINALAQAIS